MVCFIRSFISGGLVAVLTVAPVLPALAAAEFSRSDYEKCQSGDEAALRAALVTISSDALKDGIKGVDFRAVVGEQWRKNGLDAVIDKRVDIAVEEVKQETSWTERLKTLANSEAAHKLATTVAERVYHSDVVKVAMEEMATGVAKDIGKTIEFASLDASEPVLQCLKAFVGPRYGSAVSQAVAGDAGRDLTLDPNKGSSEISAGAVLKETGGGIAGATILIVRRQLATIAARVGQRIVGSVLSRLVSVAAGGVGLVLIAKDIWDFRNGVLPIIATEMKAPATKEKVQTEIATMISEQIGEHVKEIAGATADHVIEIWQAFKRAHALVLKIADSNEAFRGFLDGVKPAALPRLDEVVSLVVAAEGEPSVLKRLEDGSLNEAVHVMPEAALTIARETKSVAKALAWNALAGDKLAAVTEYELYRRANPEDFSRGALDRILALDDRTAIIRLASLSRDARDTLLGLDSRDMKSLAKSLSDGELGTLASYLNGLQPAPREQVLRSVAADPSRMQVLASERVRDAIIASADQTAAAEMMLRPAAGFSPRVFANDAVLAWEQRINPWLLWHKHPLGVAFAGLCALILMLWTRRLFRGRPPAPPQQRRTSGPDV